MRRFCTTIWTGCKKNSKRNNFFSHIYCIPACKSYTFELENAIKHYDVKLVVITNLLHYFTNDPYLNDTEMKRILSGIISSLEKIKDCLVIVSLYSKTQFDDMIQKLFSISIKIESSNNTSSVDVTSEGRQSLVTLQNDELENIQR